MRKALLSALAALLCSVAFASGPRPEGVRFAAEWGPALKILEIHHYNFLTDEGFRIDDSGALMTPFLNGFAIFRAGMYLGNCFSVSVGTGVVGYSRRQQVIPVLARVDYKIKGYNSDGPVSFAEAGIGFSDKNFRPAVPLARGGVGYRYTLGDSAGIEVSAGVWATSSHPEIWDSSENRFVPEPSVRKSEVLGLAAFAAIAIDF